MKRRGLTKGQVRALLALLLAGMALLAWFQAEVKLLAGERQAAGFSQIRLPDQPLTVAQVNQLQEDARDNYEEGRRPSYTGWTQQGAVTIENLNLERQQKLPVIYGCGSISSTLPVVAEGGLCINEETADALFGTRQIPVGTKLTVAGETYTVEQVLPAGSPPVVARLKASSDILLEVLDIDRGNLSRLEFSPETVLVSAGLNSRVVLEYEGLFAAAKSLRNLPLWLGLLVLAGRLLGRSGRRLRQQGWTAWGRTGMWQCVLALVVLAGGALVLGTPFALPQRFVPTMWSDFQFWSEAFADFAAQTRLVLSMELYGPDQQLRSLLVGLVAWGWLCGGLLLLAGCLLQPLMREERGEIGSSDVSEPDEGI